MTSRDRYGTDILSSDWRAPKRGRAVEAPAVKGEVVEEVTTDFCGEIVQVDRDLHTVTLEDRRRQRRTFPLGPGFLHEGRPVILVAHSAGVLMVAHWAALHSRPIKGALLAAPPDLEATWPQGYPTSESLRAHGWDPLPQGTLPFPSLVAGSTNDHLASLDAVTRMAQGWGAELRNFGAVGHLNPAAGFGHWPEAEALILELDR